MKIAYPLIASLALATLPGCGSSIAGYCADGCDCAGCNDDKRAECEDHFEDIQRNAENDGCEDRFDAYMDCKISELECRSGRVDDDGCESEYTALIRCSRPFIPFIF